jgi:hypothetical protein
MRNFTKSNIPKKYEQIKVSGYYAPSGQPATPAFIPDVLFQLEQMDMPEKKLVWRLYDTLGPAGEDGPTGAKLPSCAEAAQILEDFAPGFPAHWQDKLEDLRRLFRECQTYTVSVD